MFLTACYTVFDTSISKEKINLQRSHLLYFVHVHPIFVVQLYYTKTLLKNLIKYIEKTQLILLKTISNSNDTILSPTLFFF